MLIKKSDASCLVTATVLNTKISEVENKIPNTSSLFTIAVLNIKISEVENKNSDNSKNITTQEFNELTAENLAARLRQAALVNKTDFDDKIRSFNKRITSNKAKYLEVRKKLNSLTEKKIIIFSYVEFYFTSNDGS